jgi:hypothetical protein
LRVREPSSRHRRASARISFGTSGRAVARPPQRAPLRRANCRVLRPGEAEWTQNCPWKPNRPQGPHHCNGNPLATPSTLAHTHPPACHNGKPTGRTGDYSDLCESRDQDCLSLEAPVCTHTQAHKSTQSSPHAPPYLSQPRSATPALRRRTRLDQRSDDGSRAGLRDAQRGEVQRRVAKNWMGCIRVCGSPKSTAHSSRALRYGSASGEHRRGDRSLDAPLSARLVCQFDSAGVDSRSASSAFTWSTAPLYAAKCSTVFWARTSRYCQSWDESAQVHWRSVPGADLGIEDWLHARARNALESPCVVQLLAIRPLQVAAGQTHALASFPRAFRSSHSHPVASFPSYLLMSMARPI